ncbi:MAG TPA: VOC family protein [Bryobacteraceae bacterium]
MALKRMDNVGIVVDDLGGTIDFFRGAGHDRRRMGRTCHWTGRSGRRDCHHAHAGRPARAFRFLTPPVVADHRNAPVNALGYLRVMFAVDDIDETLERLRKHGAQLVGEVVQYKDAYRLCYIRGPEGLLIGLAQELS